MFKFSIFLGLCLALLFGFLPTPQVFADVSLDSDQGIVDSTVTISALPAGDSYIILWDDASFNTGTVPSSGTVSFIVPETYGGAHSLDIESPGGYIRIQWKFHGATFRKYQPR